MHGNSGHQRLVDAIVQFVGLCWVQVSCMRPRAPVPAVAGEGRWSGGGTVAGQPNELVTSASPLIAKRSREILQERWEHGDRGA